MDPDCHGKFRFEQWFGADSSAYISVDSSCCIENRIIKLLQYLDFNNPSQSWNQFYTGNTINWSKIMVGYQTGINSDVNQGLKQLKPHLLV